MWQPCSSSMPFSDWFVEVCAAVQFATAAPAGLSSRLTGTLCQCRSHMGRGTAESLKPCSSVHVWRGSHVARLRGTEGPPHLGPSVWGSIGCAATLDRDRYVPRCVGP